MHLVKIQEHELVVTSMRSLLFSARGGHEIRVLRHRVKQRVAQGFMPAHAHDTEECGREQEEIPVSSAYECVDAGSEWERDQGARTQGKCHHLTLPCVKKPPHSAHLLSTLDASPSMQPAVTPAP